MVILFGYVHTQYLIIQFIRTSLHISNYLFDYQMIIHLKINYILKLGIRNTHTTIVFKTIEMHF